MYEKVKRRDNTTFNDRCETDDSIRKGLRCHEKIASHFLRG